MIGFRRQICTLAAGYYQEDTPRTSLDIDCDIPAELLTIHNIESLNVLEPCGNCCPKPVLMMKHLTIERITMVGGGRHMRLRLRSGRFGLNAIYFSANPETASIQPGDVVDVAFTPNINEFRGERSVQMNILDIRPSCTAPCSPETSDYHALIAGRLTPETAASLIPDRAMLAMVWRYLAAAPGALSESPICLCRKIVRWTNKPMSLGQMNTCLDIFRDVGLLEITRLHKSITIRLTPGPGKADLNTSQTMQRLLQAKES